MLCGSSSDDIATFGKWDAEVLEEAGDYVDYLSVHCYCVNPENDTSGYFNEPERLASLIEKMTACCNQWSACRKTSRKIMLSLDEWNACHRNGVQKKESPPWIVGRPVHEEELSVEDAILTGMLLSTILNNADRVRIACIAQIVNFKAPVMRETDGTVWKQLTYWPLMLTSRYGRGTALRGVIESPGCPGADGVEISALHTAGVYNGERGEVVIFAANRNLGEKMELCVTLGNFTPEKIVETLSMHHHDLKLTNTPQRENFRPCPLETAQLSSEGAYFILPPASWSMIRIALKTDLG